MFATLRPFAALLICAVAGSAQAQAFNTSARAAYVLD